MSLQSQLSSELNSCLLAAQAHTECVCLLQKKEFHLEDLVSGLVCELLLEELLAT